MELELYCDGYGGGGGGGQLPPLPPPKHLRYYIPNFSCPKGLDSLREVTEPHSFMISTTG